MQRQHALADDANRSTLESLPDQLTSPRAKLVYLCLDVGAAATVEDLQRTLGLRALTLYPILDGLVDRGLVARREGGYVTT